jgi:hypothetical protein
MATSEDIIKEFYAYAEDSTNKRGYIGTKTIGAVDSLTTAIKSASAKITAQMLVERFVPKSAQKAVEVAEKKKKSSKDGSYDENTNLNNIKMSKELKKTFEKVFVKENTQDRVMIKQNIKYNNKLLPLMIDYYRDLRKEKSLDPKGMGVPAKTSAVLDDAKNKGTKLKKGETSGGGFGLGLLGILGGLAALILGFDAIAKDSKILQSIKIGVKLLPKIVSTVGGFLGKLFKPLAKLLGLDKLLKSKTGIGSFARMIYKFFQGTLKTKTFGGKILQGVLKFFKVAGKGLLRKVPVIGSIINIGEAIAQFSGGDKIGGIMSLMSAFASLFPGIGTGVSIIIDLLQLARNSALTKDERANMGFGDQMKKVGGFIWEKIKEWAGKLWNWLTDKFAEGLQYIVDSLKIAWASFKEKFPNLSAIISKGFEGLKIAIDGIGSFVSGIIDGATDKINEFLGIHEPKLKQPTEKEIDLIRYANNTNPKDIKTKKDLEKYFEGSKLASPYAGSDWKKAEEYAIYQTGKVRQQAIGSVFGDSLDKGEMSLMNRFLAGEKNIKGLELLYDLMGHNAKDAKVAYEQFLEQEVRRNPDSIFKAKDIDAVLSGEFLDVIKEEKAQTQKILDNMNMTLDTIATAIRFFGDEMGKGLQGLGNVNIPSQSGTSMSNIQKPNYPSAAWAASLIGISKDSYRASTSS